MLMRDVGLLYLSILAQHWRRVIAITAEESNVRLTVAREGTRLPFLRQHDILVGKSRDGSMVRNG